MTAIAVRRWTLGSAILSGALILAGWVLYILNRSVPDSDMAVLYPIRTNVAKYAEATLAGIVDRLAALDGTVDVTSAPGQGTALHGRLPIGSDGALG